MPSTSRRKRIAAKARFCGDALTPPSTARLERKRSDLRRTHFRRVSLAVEVEEDEAADRADVGLLDLRAPMAKPKRLAHAVEEPRLLLRLRRAATPNAIRSGSTDDTGRSVSPRLVGGSRSATSSGRASDSPARRPPYRLRSDRGINAASTSSPPKIVRRPRAGRQGKSWLHARLASSTVLLVEPMAHAWHTGEKKPKPPAGFEPATC
jgi:hypothetical protein